MPAGFSLRLDLPLNLFQLRCSAWAFLAHSKASCEISLLLLCQGVFPTFWQYRKHCWASEYVEGRESFAAIFSVESLAGSTGSPRVTPDPQSSRVCTLFPLWLQCGDFCCHPACSDVTQSWLGPSGSSTQTQLGAFLSLLTMGETGIVEVMASSGQSSLCGSFSLPRLSGESNKNLPRLMLLSLCGLSCISQFATAVPNTQLEIFQVNMVLPI